MNKFYVFIYAGLVFAACNTNNSIHTNTSSADSTKPVETKPPNTSYKPAFAGQTRIGAIKTKTPYEAKLITSDLKSPWGITVLPDGRFLITQKAGTMRIAANGCNSAGQTQQSRAHRLVRWPARRHGREQRGSAWRSCPRSQRGIGPRSEPGRAPLQEQTKQNWC